MQVNPDMRLGHTKGMQEIKAHPWFSEIDWVALLKKEIRPPKLHKYKKGTVNLLPPKTGPRPSDDFQQDEDMAKLFSSFDFVTRSDATTLQPIDEELEPRAPDTSMFYIEDESSSQ